MDVHLELSSVEHFAHYDPESRIFIVQGEYLTKADLGLWKIEVTVTFEDRGEELTLDEFFYLTVNDVLPSPTDDLTVAIEEFNEEPSV